jgi:hypothetical protein
VQNSFRLAPDIGQAALAAVAEKYPFPEIQYMRLIVWKERETQMKGLTRTALAGRHLQSYCLPFMPGVFMDFYSRSAKLRPASVTALSKILCHTHVVEEYELFTIEEILNHHWGDALDQNNTIDQAQVGDLNGKLALAIEWMDAYKNCRRISVYIDSDQDGTAVEEIHFSAPLESFDLAKKYFSEVLRSMKWQDCACET